MNTDDRYHHSIRHGLGTLGDRAGPTPSFDELTLTPVAPNPVEASLRRPRWAVTAAVLIAVLAAGVVLSMRSGNDTPSLEVTNSPDRAYSNTSSDIDQEPACALNAIAFNVEDTNTVVFMEPTATAAQIDAVAERLSASSEVSWHIFVAQRETYEEFVDLFSDNPEIIDTISPADLPPSFRFELPQVDAQLLTEARLLIEIGGYDGVQTINTSDGFLNPRPEAETD